MFRFEDPTYLWLLLLVPALVAIRIIGLRSQRKRMALLGNPTLLRTLSPGISRRRPAIKFWLLMAPARRREAASRTRSDRAYRR